jgi:hypothetical protein
MYFPFFSLRKAYFPWQLNKTAKKNVHLHFLGGYIFFLKEGTCFDRSALHRFVYKQDPKEKENYKEFQNSC